MRFTEPWVGFDFDGTLAREHTFEPVPLMMERLQGLLDQGVQCRIVTARANDRHGIALVKEWLEKHNLPDLEVTSQKDYMMVVLYDDRARQVVRNEGVVVGENEPTVIPRTRVVLPNNKIVVPEEDHE